MIITTLGAWGDDGRSAGIEEVHRDYAYCPSSEFHTL